MLLGNYGVPQQLVQQEPDCEIEQFTVIHSYAGSSDDMPIAPTRILNVLQSGIPYQDPTDYVWDGDYALQWYPNGMEPVVGTHYYLTVEVCN